METLRPQTSVRRFIINNYGDRRAVTITKFSSVHADRILITFSNLLFSFFAVSHPLAGPCSNARVILVWFFCRAPEALAAQTPVYSKTSHCRMHDGVAPKSINDFTGAPSNSRVKSEEDQTKGYRNRQTGRQAEIPRIAGLC